jgi:hypothetical protein
MGINPTPGATTGTGQQFEGRRRPQPPGAGPER